MHTAGPRDTVMRGIVRDLLFQGKNYRLSMETEKGQILVFDLSGEILLPQMGARIRLVLQSSGILIMTPDAKI